MSPALAGGFWTTSNTWEARFGLFTFPQIIRKTSNRTTRCLLACNRHRFRRRKWQPTPVFLPGESCGQGSLVVCCPWGHTGLDTTEVTQQQQQQAWISRKKALRFVHTCGFAESGVLPVSVLRQSHLSKWRWGGECFDSLFGLSSPGWRANLNAAGRGNFSTALDSPATSDKKKKVSSWLVVMKQKPKVYHMIIGFHFKYLSIYP